MLIGELGRRLMMLVRRRRFERELDEEMQFHLALSGDAARQRFGNPTLLKELSRDMWGWNSLEILLQDARYALRTMRRNLGFTLVVIATLALGIGATTAMFSIVDGVLLRPLPFPDQERLVAVFSFFSPPNQKRGPFSVADYLDLSAQVKSFEQFAAYAQNRTTLTGVENPEVISTESVTTGFFSVIGARPLLGRIFVPEDGRSNSPRVVILSEALWRRVFNADPHVLGRGLILNGSGATIVGVMPASFQFPQRGIELWSSMRFQPPQYRFPFFLRGVAKLKPGVTMRQAQAELDAIAPGIERSDPKTYSHLRFPVMPLREALVGNTRLPLLVLLAAVVLVLVIACVNVANLLLARAASREREMAIRMGIGASHVRLLRQLLTESLLMSLAGGVAGAALAMWGVAGLRTLKVANIPRLESVHIDTQALAFTLLVALLCGILFGLAPALASVRFRLNDSLKQHERSGTESQGRRRLRSALVAAEIALSFLLLAGAGLLLRSFSRLQDVDPGFRTRDLLVARISPSGAKYNDGPPLNALFRNILDALRTIPGAQAVALSGCLPPDLVGWNEGYRIEGRSAVEGHANPSVTLNVVTADYFRTLEIPVLRGRAFTEHDNETSAPVVIISETMARRNFPDQDPIGKRLMFGWSLPNQPWREIVGVVGDVKYRGLDAEPEAAYYAPLSQNPYTAVYATVRVANPSRLTAALRARLAAVEKDLPVSEVGTIQAALSSSVAQPRFRATLLVAFAAAALLLATIGIYGLMAYSVTQRLREFGIRIALGAQRRDVLYLVMRWCAVLVAAGMTAGAAASLAFTRLLKTLLFHVNASDPITYLSVGVLLLTVSVAATLVPAFRATRTDPVTALREE